MAENIRRMRQDGVNVAALEATYTTLHQKENISKKDTILFLRQTFGIDNVVCAFCEGDADLSPRDIESLDIDEERVWEIKQCLAREGSIPAESCLAGIQSMTILPDGDIYPCHRLIGNTEYRMFQNNQFTDWETSDQYRKVSQLFRNVDKVRNRKCQRCWANRLCIMCPIALLSGGASSCDSELKAVEFTIAQV